MKDNLIVEKMARLDGVWGRDDDYEARPYSMERWGKYIGDHCVCSLPAYLADHNAVQRVIDGLNLDEGQAYAFELNGGYYYDDLYEVSGVLKATPAQKCEAVLKAKGVWDDQ